MIACQDGGLYDEGMHATHGSLPAEGSTSLAVQITIFYLRRHDCNHVESMSVAVPTPYGAWKRIL